MTRNYPNERKMMESKNMNKKLAIIPAIFLVLAIALIAPVSATAGYGQTVMSYAGIGSGSVNNPSEITGSPNGVYTQLYGGNQGDGASIDVYMQSQGASGAAVYFYGYSYSGYYTHVYVYVSNDNSNWQLVGSGYVTSSTPGWYSVGNAPIAFHYGAIAAYDDQGYSARLLVDSIYNS
jgi:hypothetical protein